ncbi:MAG: hypothetical protein AB2L14_10110 [Candidatus Xenobiia bacterium LiM19]
MMIPNIMVIILILAVARMLQGVFPMNRGRKMGAAIFLFCLAALLMWLAAEPLPAFSQQEGPGQVWISAGAEAPVSKKLRASLSTELRYDEAGLYYQNWELALVSRISPKVD